MSIELHCPQCAKLIRAPDDAGGKHGKCPYCECKIYIPTPHDDGETIQLAPIDEQELKREAELRREAIAMESQVAHESAKLPPETGAPPRAARSQPTETPGEVIDTAAQVQRFLIAMRDSKLDQADQAVALLKRGGERSLDFVQGLLVDEMPPQVENVPPPVLTGFLKTLLGRLS